MLGLGGLRSGSWGQGGWGWGGWVAYLTCCVANLLCGESSVANLPCGESSGNLQMDAS